MFSALRGGGGYQPLDGSDSSDVESQSGSDSSDDRSVNSMDLNGDGIVTEQEAREYVKTKLSDRIRNVVNLSPNTLAGSITNITLGTASIVGAHYGGDLLDEDTKTKLSIAGYAMVGTGTSSLIGMTGKWIFGKPLPESEPKNKPDITRIV